MKNGLRAVLTLSASSVLVFLMCDTGTCDAPPSKVKSGVANQPHTHSYRQLFQFAMRSRDLDEWQNALILFEQARRAKAIEGERVRLYGRRRFPIYAPGFYIAEALFNLGNFDRAFQIWSDYDSGGDRAALVSNQERKIIKEYRRDYRAIISSLMGSAKRDIAETRAALVALESLTARLGAEGRREVESRLRAYPPSCSVTTDGTLEGPAGSPLEASLSRRFQEIHVCVANADELAKTDESRWDYSLVQHLRRELEAAMLLVVDCQRALRAGEPTPAKEGVSNGSLYRVARVMVGVTLPGATWSQRMASFRSSSPIDAPARVAKGLPDLPRTYTKRYALVIGLSEYQLSKRQPPPRPRLSAVQTDIDAIALVFKNMGYTVTLVRDPRTKGEILSAIDGFIDHVGDDPNNHLLIYYAGHGATVPSSPENAERNYDGGYLVPIDAEPYDAANPWAFVRSAVSFDQLAGLIAAIPTRHAMFVFDSCFSGQILKDLGLRILIREEKAELAHGVGAALRKAEAARREAPPAPEDRIRTFLQKRTRWYLTAAAADQRAANDHTFCRAFIEGLQGKTRPEFPGFVTAEELSAYVVESVRTSSKEQQRPVSGNLGVEPAIVGVFFPVQR